MEEAVVRGLETSRRSGWMAACPCVLVLCGAPAAGKSSLCRELSRRPARRVEAVHHISFDSIERDSSVRPLIVTPCLSFHMLG